MPNFPYPVDEELYRGYDLSDIELIESFKDPCPSAVYGFRVDYFGARTRLSLLGTCGAGDVITTPPLPGDGLLSEGVEYASMCIALKHSPGPMFTHIEIGAGWGPWTALLATLAVRKGFSVVNAVALEASFERFELLKMHLADNGLLADENVNHGVVDNVFTKAINAAGWWCDTTLFFPKTKSLEDAGMAASSADASIDYRGVPVENIAIEAVSIEKVCAPYDHVDFLHIDIQGGEWDVIRHSKAILDSKVRYMFVGTHSRKIEGDLIGLLLNNGWRLMREKPCRFRGMVDAPTLTALTYHDGGQFWANATMT